MSDKVKTKSHKFNVRVDKKIGLEKKECRFTININEIKKLNELKKSFVNENDYLLSERSRSNYIQY